MKENSIIISFYNSYPITSGSSAVTTAFFNAWPGRKKLFLMNHETEIKKKNINNFKIKSNNSFIKFIYLIPYLLFIYSEIKKMKIKYIIFEGASWTGFIYISYLFFLILGIKAKFIYHAHNVDYFFRRKNIFISSLSFYFEKKILQNFFLSTSVSEADFRTFKSLFKIKTKVLPNGIEVIKSKLKKKMNDKYIFFSGSLEYKQNKKIFNKLIKNEFKILQKYIPEIKIYHTGGGKFKFYKGNKNIIEFGTLSFNNYLNLLKNSLCVIIPGSNVTGTKIKIIEALCYDKTVFAHKKSLQGIKSKFIKHFVYKDLKEFENKIQNFKKNKYNNNNFKLIGKYFREKYSMKNIVKEFYVKNKL